MTLTRNVADAHGAEGVRVNLLNAGWTLTSNEHALKMKEGLPEDLPARLPKVFAPSGRLLSPEEVARAAIYFLSDEAALVNGAVLDLSQYPRNRIPPAPEEHRDATPRCRLTAPRVAATEADRRANPDHSDAWRELR